MHACIYQHLFLLHFMYFFHAQQLTFLAAAGTACKLHSFFCKFKSIAGVCILCCACACCDIYVMWYRQNCAAHLCHPLQPTFLFPFQGGLRRNTLVSASWKTINVAVGIKNCLFFLNSVLLILSVNVYSFVDIPRCGVSNSLWYPLFLKENPPLTTQLLIKTLNSCEEQDSNLPVLSAYTYSVNNKANKRTVTLPTCSWLEYTLYVQLRHIFRKR